MCWCSGTKTLVDSLNGKSMKFTIRNQNGASPFLTVSWQQSKVQSMWKSGWISSSNYSWSQFQKSFMFSKTATSLISNGLIKEITICSLWILGSVCLGEDKSCWRIKVSPSGAMLWTIISCGPSTVL